MLLHRGQDDLAIAPGTIEVHHGWKVQAMELGSFEGILMEKKTSCTSIMDQMEFLGGSKNWGFARKTVWMVYTMVPTWLKKCSPFRKTLEFQHGVTR